MGNPKPPGVHAGHSGRYKDCRHADCLAYRERYRKRWTYERSHGQMRLGDTTQARLHIAALEGAGWSLRSIAGAADLAPPTVYRLAHGQQKASKLTLAAVLAIDPEQVPCAASRQTGEPFVPKIGTVRRIQALIFMGWPHHELTARSGVRTGTVLSQRGRWVTRTTHDKIARLYRELSHVPGPSNRSHHRALKLGYVGPTAWDDIDLDAEPEPEDLDEAS